MKTKVSIAGLFFFFFPIDFVSLRVTSAIISVFDFGSVQNQLGPATIKTPTYSNYELLCVCLSEIR